MWVDDVAGNIWYLARPYATLGDVVWSFNVSGRVSSSPALYASMLYVATERWGQNV